MTAQEFKAWFEGFSEGIAGRPTEKQWQRICKRAKEIDGAPLTYPIYVDRWVKPYWTPWWTAPVYCATTGQLQNAATTTTATDFKMPTLQDIGRAEFSDLTQQ